MRRLESISRKVRQRFYYSVPVAGAKIELGRSQSYKFLLVPRKRWDRTVKRLLGTVTKTEREDAAKKQTAEAAAAPP